MAREERDREDLLREATALVRRIQLRTEDGEEYFMGFRGDGAASTYYGSDPVFHFNAAGELRRAYVSGKLYKAEHGTLVQLTRERSDDEVTLLRREIPAAATDLFLAMVNARLLELRTAITAEAVVVVGQVPSDGDLLLDCVAELERLQKVLKIADSPRAR